LKSAFIGEHPAQHGFERISADLQHGTRLKNGIEGTVKLLSMPFFMPEIRRHGDASP
jgi:hypothetical protein